METGSSPINFTYIVGLKGDGKMDCSCLEMQRKAVQNCHHINQVQRETAEEFRNQAADLIYPYMRAAAASLIELTNSEFPLKQYQMPDKMWKKFNVAGFKRLVGRAISNWKNLGSQDKEEALKRMTFISRSVFRNGDGTSGAEPALLDYFFFSFEIIGIGDRERDLALITRLMGYHKNPYNVINSDYDYPHAPFLSMKQRLSGCFDFNWQNKHWKFGLADKKKVFKDGMIFLDRLFQVFSPNVCILGREITKRFLQEIISPYANASDKFPPPGWHKPGTINCSAMLMSMENVLSGHNLADADRAIESLKNYLDNLKEVLMEDFGRERYSKFLMNEFLDSSVTFPTPRTWADLQI